LISCHGVVTSFFLTEQGGKHGWRPSPQEPRAEAGRRCRGVGEQAMDSLELRDIQERKKIVGYRIGVYDPDPASHKVRLFKHVYSTGQYDQLVMEQVLLDVRSWAAAQSQVTLCVAAFPVRVRDILRDIMPPLNEAAKGIVR
jgi:hypothetical protein